MGLTLISIINVFMGVSQPGRNVYFIFCGISINFASMLASSGDELFTSDFNFLAHKSGYSGK
jgi:hypothetical protein